MRKKMKVFLSENNCNFTAETEINSFVENKNCYLKKNHVSCFSINLQSNKKFKKIKLHSDKKYCLQFDRLLTTALALQCEIRK
jgi:hypothetical protein